MGEAAGRGAHELHLKSAGMPGHASRRHHLPALHSQRTTRGRTARRRAGGAPDKAQRARTFLEAEFDDAVNALKQQARLQNLTELFDQAIDALKQVQ